MTVAAIAGPRLDLDGPRPVAPPHSLVSTPGVVRSRDDGRWLNGVNVVGYPASLPSVWNQCQEDVSPANVKGEGGDLPQAGFDPFAAYLPVSCSALSYSFLQEWSEIALDATISFAAEAVLARGGVGGVVTNPYLGDTNVDLVNGTTAVSPAVGLSYLEEAIGETGRRGMIHATPATVAGLEAFPVGASDVLVTANGTPVVSGGGYIGASADGNAAADGQSWMFASGPVEVRLSTLVITDLSETLDRSDNTLTFRAERWVLVTWDTALQAAVLVDWAA